MRFIGTVVSKVRNYVYRPARLAGSHVTPTCLNIVLSHLSVGVVCTGAPLHLSGGWIAFVGVMLLVHY